MVWICKSLYEAHGHRSDAGWQALLLWKLHRILSFNVQCRVQSNMTKCRCSYISKAFDCNAGTGSSCKTCVDQPQRKQEGLQKRSDFSSISSSGKIAGPYCKHPTLNFEKPSHRGRHSHAVSSRIRMPCPDVLSLIHRTTIVPAATPLGQQRYRWA